MKHLLVHGRWLYLSIFLLSSFSSMAPGQINGQSNSTVKVALDSLFPANSPEHMRANIATLERCLSTGSPNDPWTAKAYHVLGMQHMYLHQPKEAAVDFEAALKFPESAKDLHLHSSQNRMAALSLSGDLDGAIKAAEEVVKLSGEAHVDSDAVPNALLLRAQWTRNRYASQKDVDARVAAAYRDYLRVSDARSHNNWRTQDAQALRGLEFTLQKEGKYKEAAAVCSEFLKRLPTDPEAIYMADERARAKHAGFFPDYRELAEILKEYPQNSADRAFVSLQYAQALTIAQRPAVAESSLRYALNYTPDSHDVDYNPGTNVTAGLLLAKLLAQQHRFTEELAVRTDLLRRFPDDLQLKFAIHQVITHPGIEKSGSVLGYLPWALVAFLVLSGLLWAILARVRSR